MLEAWLSLHYCGKSLRVLVEHQQITRCFAFKMSVSAMAQISDHQAPSGERVPGSIQVSLCRADVFSHGSASKSLSICLTGEWTCVRMNGARVLGPHPSPRDVMLPYPNLQERQPVSRLPINTNAAAKLGLTFVHLQILHSI